MKNLFAQEVLAFGFAACALGSLIHSAKADTPDYTALFATTGKTAAYDTAAKNIDIFARNGEALERTKKFAVVGNVWALTETPKGYAVATGQGRGDLLAPIRITLFDKDGKSLGVIFQHSGERSQVSFLKWANDKLWITYFDSKFVTKTGYLTPANTGPWIFTETQSLRLGDATDVVGNFVVIGRPYGDVQGQDGDAFIFNGTEKIELPTYRGVRSVAFLGDPRDPQIAIGDGWHQSYAQFGQARISLVKKDSDSGKYALELIDRDPTQYNFSRIVPFSIGKDTYLLAVGSKDINVYGPGPKWNRKTVYTRTKQDGFFDAAIINQEGKATWVAVLDDGVKAVRFDTP